MPFKSILEKTRILRRDKTLVAHDRAHAPEVNFQQTAAERRARQDDDQEYLEFVRHRRQAERQRHEAEPDREMRARFGVLSVDDSEDRTMDDAERVRLAGLSTERDVGRDVFFQCRVHAIRRMGAHLVFVVLRQQVTTVQGVLKEERGLVSEAFVRWAEHIPTECVVLVRGTLQRPDSPVQATTFHDMEISLREIHVVATLTKDLPFSVHQADAPRRDEDDRTIADRTLLAHRLLDLRTPTAQSIFRINSGICNLFRSYLDQRGFIEIHTPKLQGGATESGSSVFKLNYFDREAFLAQSPQLAKQMCISADFERVYEIGPVFRAEDSNTHRHLTEYTGLDLEMAFDNDYHETMGIIDGMLKHVFEGVYGRYGKELEAIERSFPHEKLLWLDETPVLRFTDAIRMLRESGWTDEDGNPPDEYEDMGTRDEIRLGELMREKYKTDYYILDKFPTSARPFYTMVDGDDERVTNSFDIFVRGQEITTGGQRIHDAETLERKMLKAGMQTQSMEDYLDGFRYGVPPHAGCGIGLERIVMLLLNLGNIRFASLFPRDPKSLPKPAAKVQLRFPEASTLHPPWAEDQKNEANGEDDGEAHVRGRLVEDRGLDDDDPATNGDAERRFPRLGKLIANYGDASNTSWLDDRYLVWRHDETGAAVGYVPVKGYAIILGDPLCDRSQQPRIIASFLRYLERDTKLSPIWMLVSEEVEQVFGERFGWSSLTCAAEERVDAMSNPAANEADVQRKVRHAHREGVKITTLPAGTRPPPELRERCDARIQDWKENRHGAQMHITELNPWRDWQHRRYLYAEDRDGTVQALMVLATLSFKNGYQFKYSLDFPGAPSGTIEAINMAALELAASSGAKTVTFGVEANTFQPGHNLSGVRVKMLQKTFNGIAQSFKLAQKSGFRRKLGAREEAVYIVYPPHSLGSGGVKAIMTFLGDD